MMAMGQPFQENRIAPLDLWRVHLDQCPECGRVHGCHGSGGGHGGKGGKFAGGLRGPERHIYDYAQSVSDDLLCPLCCDVLQTPVQTPCAHHYCSECMRTLLMRTSGKVACPLDGQVLTRFALQAADAKVLKQLDELRVRCPVCGEQVRKADLKLHLQDPVNMVEPPEAYEAILRPFYMSCPLSNFTVGELNGSSSLIRFYRRLGEPALRRFVLTTEDFIVLPDPKMGFQPHTDEDAEAFRKHGGYFVAWWVHPSFRPEVWWRRPPAADPTAEAAGAGKGGGHPAEVAFRACREALRKRDEAASLLGSLDCSSEPWHASSFMHTWSSVEKPSSPRYLCCLRDLREDHIAMLEAFRKNVLQWLKDNYSVGEDRVMMYCHYPSSARFSTLHFHIVFSGEESSRYSKYALKSDRPHQLSRQFALSEVIDTLKRDPRHFETCTMCYYLGDKADLMDPISAHFGISPHRYVQDFTFQWDPSAVLGVQHAPPLPGCSGSPMGRGSIEAISGARQASAGAVAAAASAGSERVQLQIAEVARAVASLRGSVEEQGRQLQEVLSNQRIEERGASKLVLLQLASLTKLESQDLKPHSWSSGPALLAAAAAGAAAAILVGMAFVEGGRRGGGR